MIRPGATLGLLGGGQLGRMFTPRARSMGFDVWVLDPDPDSPAGGVASQHLQFGYDDPEGLTILAQGCAAVTTEFENVPARALDRLAEATRVVPPPAAVAIAQDRIREKNFFQQHGIPTAPFAAVRNREDLAVAWGAIGTPALLKTSRLGYDGKGQATVTSGAELEAAWHRFGQVDCVLERRLALELELSVVLARDDSGTTAPFPVAENVHRDGILFTSVVPARIGSAQAAAAVALAERIASGMDYVGVMAVELFVADGGLLYANELAPRPHNSGHYTIDACGTDQFEQQIRALCGLPLGAPALLSPVCMVNLLGDLWQHGEPPWERVLAMPGVNLHLYGKRAPRPGRKMGHLCCLAATPDAALALARRAFEAVSLEPVPPRPSFPVAGVHA